MPKLNVVLRTCDRVSLAADRIVPKDQCIYRCLNSLVTSLSQQDQPWSLHIIDDASSAETRAMIQKIAPMATFDFLPERDQSDMNGKQKSRHSVRVAYDYIYTLPADELLYIVEDDYLHYPDSIENMLEAYEYFSRILPTASIGIFPQDFPELYPHERNPFNDTYVRQCMVIPGPDRYYRTTWFTHESFMIPLVLIWRYREHFEKLMDIGTVEGAWEGTSLSNVWQQGDVAMLMPMRTLALHVSKQNDLPFFNTDFETLWHNNQVN